MGMIKTRNTYLISKGWCLIILNLIDSFLLSFNDEFNVFIDRGEFSTLPNKDVPKAKALTEKYAQLHPEAKEVCDKLIKQFDVAIEYGSDVDFA